MASRQCSISSALSGRSSCTRPDEASMISAEEILSISGTRPMLSAAENKRLVDINPNVDEWPDLKKDSSSEDTYYDSSSSNQLPSNTLRPKIPTTRRLRSLDAKSSKQLLGSSTSFSQNGESDESDCPIMKHEEVSEPSDVEPSNEESDPNNSRDRMSVLNNIDAFQFKHSLNGTSLDELISVENLTNAEDSFNVLNKLKTTIGGITKEEEPFSELLLDDNRAEVVMVLVFLL